MSDRNCDPRRVPETATVLLGGGVNFADLPEYAQIEFQVKKRKIDKTWLAVETDCLTVLSSE